MDLDNVVISVFDGRVAIEYPDAETKGSVDRQPCDLMDSDYDFNHGLTQHPGFRIHHIETLQPVIYYLRFLIDHDTNQGKDMTRYVVSARINLNNFCHSDLLELIDKVVDKIKSM